MPRSAEGVGNLTEPLAGRDLAAFVSAVEAGTIQGAAERLNLSQSAATKRVQALERRFGVSLFRRSRHGVTPTEAGRLLYPEARRALEALSSAERTLTDHHGEITVRIAASHTIGDFLLPGWLGKLRDIVPGLCPQVDIVNSSTVLSRLRALEIDVGFIEGEDSLDGLKSVPLVNDEIVAVVASDHPWAKRAEIAAQDLMGEPLVARERGSGTRAIAESRLRAAGVDLAPVLQLSSLEGVKRALRGGGVALLSRVAIVEETKSGALVALPIGDADLARTLEVVRRPEPLPGAGAQLLWESIAEVAAPDSRAAA